MKNADQQRAPHLLERFRENLRRRISPLGRRIARITSHEARIDVPPVNGVKLKTEVSGFCVTEDFAATDQLEQLIGGRCDHGPVHATTTRISTM